VIIKTISKYKIESPRIVVEAIEARDESNDVEDWNVHILCDIVVTFARYSSPI
jgi:hypothetical protein